nr:MAG TPA: hypothetical protein [Bacteriophage sp.]DAQ14025.1 MAG TPA: hypothetical protein [Bacteriophage sp.]DAW88681.1 MAG TPA: hypothetical protein [Bacteriophage sp.]
MRPLSGLILVLFSLFYGEVCVIMGLIQVHY